jgi:hypothetical protein
MGYDRLWGIRIYLKSALIGHSGEQLLLSEYQCGCEGSDFPYPHGHISHLLLPKFMDGKCSTSRDPTEKTVDPLLK